MKYGKRTEAEYKVLEEAQIEHFVQGHSGTLNTFYYVPIVIGAECAAT